MIFFEIFFRKSVTLEFDLLQNEYLSAGSNQGEKLTSCPELCLLTLSGDFVWRQE